MNLNKMNPEIYPGDIKKDEVTGVGNLLGFIEWVDQRTKDPTSPYTIVALDIIGLKDVNDDFGRTAGDTALRWVSYVLKEETQAPIFRAGDEFLITLTSGTHKDHSAEGKRIYNRLIQNAEQVNLQSPPANFAVIHYDQIIEYSPEDVLGAYYSALFQLKQKPEVFFEVFHAANMKPVIGFMRYIVKHTIGRLLSFGTVLEQSRQMAYTDTISELPNMRAALEGLDTAILQAELSKQPFVILLIDGDNLKPYNNISYAAGDAMIKRLASTLKTALRPNDFLARWRYGDEFIVILPDTDMGEAKLVGERMRQSIQEGAKTWVFPITISLGAASFPKNGGTANALIEMAENALHQAKGRGKNQLVEASPILL
jgi:diguanylate cyclase (GGDEF)-like protein